MPIDSTKPTWDAAGYYSAPPQGALSNASGGGPTVEQIAQMGMTPEQYDQMAPMQGWPQRQASGDETRNQLLMRLTSLLGTGGSNATGSEGDRVATPEQMQALPGYESWAQAAQAAGLDPTELITERNNNVNRYHSGSTVGRMGNWFDQSGMGELITYGTLITAGLGAGGALFGGPGAGTGGNGIFGGGAAGGGVSGTESFLAAAGPNAGIESAAAYTAAGVAPTGALPGAYASTPLTVSPAGPIGSGAATGAPTAYVPGEAYGTANTVADVAGGANTAADIIDGGSTVADIISGGGSWIDALTGILPGLLGGYMQNDAAEEAARAQERATQMQLDYLRESRDIGLELNRPFHEAATGALPTMQSMAGIPGSDPYDITTDPGYQFRQDESMRAVENSAFARGGGMSGGAARGILQQSSGLASQEFQNIFNRVSAIAGYGPQAAATGANVVNQYGTNASNAIGNAGNARASAYTAMGNTNAQTINDIGGLPWSDWFGNS